MVGAPVGDPGFAVRGEVVADEVEPLVGELADALPGGRETWGSSA
jgi:hypothetical protein